MADEDTPMPPPEGGDVLNEDMLNYLMNDDMFNVSLMVEYLCLARFPVIQIFPKHYLEEEPPANYPGRLLNTVRAKSGLTIYVYEYAIILGAGDKAFAEWSNYSRMLKTLPEAFTQHLPNKNWDEIAFLASHSNLENVAWAMGYYMDLPVGTVAPNLQTQDIMTRLDNVERERARTRASEIIASRD